MRFSTETYTPSSETSQMDWTSVQEVCQALSARDAGYIARNGNYQNSDNVIYRTVEYVNHNAAGFLDVYHFGRTADIAYIILAVHPKYRNQGIAGDMLTRVLRDAAVVLSNRYKIQTWVYNVDSTNDASKQLALKLGFKVVSQDSRKLRFERPLDSGFMYEEFGCAEILHYVDNLVCHSITL